MAEPVEELHGLGVLLAYPDYKNADVEKKVRRRFGGHIPPLFCDSGAFSAYTVGEKIDLDDYAAWLAEWGDLFTAYANLDVIGSPKGTMRNQRMLEDRGLRPMPVYHPVDPDDMLDAYMADHDYIGLGGMASKDVRKGDELAYIVSAMKAAEEKHPDRNIGFHGFGRTDWKMLRAVPWASVDSTTWMMGHRYGSQVIFANGRLFQQRANGLRKHAAALRRLGFTVGDAIRAVNGDVETSTRIGLAAMGAAQTWIRRMHRDDFLIYLAGLL